MSDTGSKASWPAASLDPKLFKHSVLSKEEELALARRMQAKLRVAERLRKQAAALREQVEAQPPDSQSAKRLQAKANRVTGQAKRRQRESDEARNGLIRHNMRLIASIAGRQAAACRHLQFTDLVLAGVQIMAEKLHLFDPDRGFRVSTYMTMWIQQAMRREIANRERTVRIPVHLLDQSRRAEQKPEPDSEWQAEEDDDSNGHSPLWPDADPVSVQRLVKVMVKQAPISLETALTAVESDNNLESLLDPADLPEYHRTFFDDPETACERQSAAWAVRRAMAVLNYKERAVLRCRFEMGLTLEDTAVALLERFHVGKQTTGGHSGKKRPANRSRRHKDQPKPTEQLTRERVRQIQNRALDKMKRRLARELGLPLD